jgi:hypothetical protein
VINGSFEGALFDAFQKIREFFFSGQEVSAMNWR